MQISMNGRTLNLLLLVMVLILRILISKILSNLMMHISVMIPILMGRILPENIHISIMQISMVLPTSETHILMKWVFRM